MMKKRSIPVLIFALSPMVLTACFGGGSKSNLSSSQGGNTTSIIQDDGVSVYTITLNACTGNKEDNRTVTGRAGTSHQLPSLTRSITGRPVLSCIFRDRVVLPVAGIPAITISFDIQPCSTVLTSFFAASVIKFQFPFSIQSLLKRQPATPALQAPALK